MTTSCRQICPPLYSVGLFVQDRMVGVTDNSATVVAIMLNVHSYTCVTTHGEKQSKSFSVEC